MTESENSQPQDDSDEDIYKDIPEFNFEDELAKLEGTKETYKQEASDLSEKVKSLTEENKELKKSNEVLKKNLSTLLKTAQAEVQRKDSVIEELRTKVESFTFRRNKSITKDKYTSTEDLEFNVKPQFETDKQKGVFDRKKTKTHENRTSSESEQKSGLEEEKRKECCCNKKKENSDCDNDRKSNYRENSKRSSRHSDNGQDTYDHDRYREKKSSRYEDSSSYRRPYRENHRDHLKYDSFDKKRHSRSSDNRFLSRRRNSRERRDDRRRDGSSEIRRSRRRGESSERSRRNTRKGRSRSREISRGSKESSVEKLKSRFSLDKDSGFMNKEQISPKPEVSDSIKSNTDIIENKKGIESCDKRISLEDEAVTLVKTKQTKEKRSGKHEKRSGLDVFSTKSPLDALYNDMVSSRSSNRFSNIKSVTTLPESDLEEGELSATLTPTEHQNTSESQVEEDWTLSFKNERPNETKPMTLYSRRMMRKFSSELNKTDNNEEKALNVEKVKESENKKVEKFDEVVEKEPGELTDDENIVESSKEFQELTKVASIESEIIEKAKEITFKEPLRREFSKIENFKVEPVPQKQIEKTTKEESNCKEIEPNKDIREVMEFSPFKNNYKLIEISPIKPSNTEHVLDFYNQRRPSNIQREQSTLSECKSSSEKSSPKIFDTSEEKDSWKNSSSEKDFEAELKIFIPSMSESPKDDKKCGKKEEKELKKRKKPTENKDSYICNEETDLGKRKRRSASNPEKDKPVTDNKSQKRKRKASESDIGKTDNKRPKIKETEPSRKSTRTKRNSKTEADSKPESVPEEENKSKEDILSFEFFKPTAKIENPVDINKAISTTTDYKMTATMSVTGVVRLETPNKCVEKLKNLMINEHMIFNVLDSKSNSQFSPLIGSKCIEMTPRRMLKNDLMLTDSEDDSVSKRKDEGKEIIDEDLEEEEVEFSEESENSECDSDSGASDFVDLL